MHEGRRASVIPHRQALRGQSVLLPLRLRNVDGSFRDHERPGVSTSIVNRQLELPHVLRPPAEVNLAFGLGSSGGSQDANAPSLRGGLST